MIELAPSVPAIGLASKDDSGRTQTRGARPSDRRPCTPAESRSAKSQGTCRRPCTRRRRLREAGRGTGRRRPQRDCDPPRHLHATIPSASAAASAARPGARSRLATGLAGARRRARREPARQDCSQRKLDVVRRLPAVCGVLRDARPDEKVERGRADRSHLRNRRRLGRQDRRNERRLVVARERPAARGHFVKHGAEREHVRPRVGFLSPKLFGRHVRHGPDDHALGREVLDHRHRRHCAEVAGRRGALRKPSQARNRAASRRSSSASRCRA